MCFIPPLCIEYRTVSSCVIVRLFRDRPYFPFRAHAHTPEGFFMLQEIRRKFLRHKKRGISNLTAGYSSLLILYYFSRISKHSFFPYDFPVLFYDPTVGQTKQLFLQTSPLYFLISYSRTKGISYSPSR